MIEGLYLDCSDAILLPLPLRLAWVGTVVDRVLELFSPRLRRHYRLQNGIDAVWQFAATESSSDKTECRRLAATLARHRKVAVNEGYADDLFNMVLDALYEVPEGTGHGCTSAVDYASTCYAMYQGFRQGIDSADAAFPDDYAHETAKDLYRFALTVYEFARITKPTAVRVAFAHLRLDTALVPLPSGVVERAKRFPPPAELEYFQSVYSPDQGT